MQSIITPCLLVCATNLLNIIVLKGRTPRLAPRKAVDQAVSLQTDNISPNSTKYCSSSSLTQDLFLPFKAAILVGKKTFICLVLIGEEGPEDQQEVSTSILEQDFPPFLAT